MQEVAACGRRIILIGDAKGAAAAGLDMMAALTMPDVDPVIAPIVYAAPIRLIAYHTAVLKGKDVDQAREFARSVTVEKGSLRDHFTTRQLKYEIKQAARCVKAITVLNPKILNLPRL